MTTNFLELATTLKYLGAKRLPEKKLILCPALGKVNKLQLYICMFVSFALLALGSSGFCYTILFITRGRPKVQLVALVVICRGALLLCCS